MDFGNSSNELKIVSKARMLAKSCYELTKELPSEEKYGLISQMQRCAVSVGSNIVEGQARGSDKDFIRFLYMARGSLSELKFQNSLCKEIYDRYINEEPIDEVGKMLSGLIKTLGAKC